MMSCHLTMSCDLALLSYPHHMWWFHQDLFVLVAISQLYAFAQTCCMSALSWSPRQYTHMPLQLRLQGNAEARGGDLKAAEQVYSQALELDIPQGKHLLHANRAGVRLTLGNAEGALHDAQAAVQLAPPTFTTAYIRQVGCCVHALLP